jgi:hypothetical protein
MTEKTRKKTTPAERITKFYVSASKKAQKFHDKIAKSDLGDDVKGAVLTASTAINSVVAQLVNIPADFGVKGSSGKTRVRQTKLVAGDKVTLISKKVAKFTRLYKGIDLASLVVINQEGSTVRVQAQDGTPNGVVTLMSRKLLLAPGETETVATPVETTPVPAAL